eukprot:3792659-Prymnesium_polylepis.1
MKGPWPNGSHARRGTRYLRMNADMPTLLSQRAARSPSNSHVRALYAPPGRMITAVKAPGTSRG